MLGLALYANCPSGAIPKPGILAIVSFFLEHVHKFDPNQGVLGCVERFEPQHRPGHPLHSAVILFHNVVKYLGKSNLVF
jgi:hypothetical protein